MNKQQLMDKMWKVRKNLIVQAFRFIALGLQFWKLVKKAH
ncbi:hypothetical protein PERMA_1462 [Persephonella marina EX-H1]|uniref:Uncharacterized protein n=1 Tax=Persephonella marina (strain DSM 14350 / EX-H1) TaxID=123214 RepID=C0QRD4_PERMH|nr:hypothetical protein PERMA_1462 [Persephonella marina EX-H1]